METPQADLRPSRWKDLKTRILGIVPLLAIAVFCITYGGILFSMLVLLCAILMLREWDNLTKAENMFLKLAGYPLTILPCACLLWLRSQETVTEPQLGMKLVFTFIGLIAATDIGAYFTGKTFGRRRLAPIISPNKTWEGLGGGMLFCALLALFTLPALLGLTFATSTFIGLLVAFLAQTGDIFESFIKRRAGVKDSGSLIPGHGGLLDRVDGYLLAAPAFAWLVHMNPIV